MLGRFLLAVGRRAFGDGGGGRLALLRAFVRLRDPKAATGSHGKILGAKTRSNVGRNWAREGRGHAAVEALVDALLRGYVVIAALGAFVALVPLVALVALVALIALIALIALVILVSADGPIFRSVLHSFRNHNRSVVASLGQCSDKCLEAFVGAPLRGLASGFDRHVLVIRGGNFFFLFFDLVVHVSSAPALGVTNVSQLTGPKWMMQCVVQNFWPGRVRLRHRRARFLVQDWHILRPCSLRGMVSWRVVILLFLCHLHWNDGLMYRRKVFGRGRPQYLYCQHAPMVLVIA
ncbi:hypothetical protein IWX48DRAFT_366706 [Phyllosticta citricarpa]